MLAEAIIICPPATGTNLDTTLSKSLPHYLTRRNFLMCFLWWSRPQHSIQHGQAQTSTILLQTEMVQPSNSDDYPQAPLLGQHLGLGTIRSK